MGYWTYDDQGEFHDLYEMWDYIRDNEYYFDEIDFERWVNDVYSASRVIYELNEAMQERGAAGIEERLLEFYDDFEDDLWSPSSQDDLIEGRDYHYGPNGEFEFKWISEEGDDDEEEAYE